MSESSNNRSKLQQHVYYKVCMYMFVDLNWSNNNIVLNATSVDGVLACVALWYLQLFVVILSQFFFMFVYYFISY